MVNFKSYLGEKRIYVIKNAWFRALDGVLNNNESILNNSESLFGTNSPPLQMSVRHTTTDEHIKRMFWILFAITLSLFNSITRIIRQPVAVTPLQLFYHQRKKQSHKYVCLKSQQLLIIRPV